MGLEPGTLSIHTAKSVLSRGKGSKLTSGLFRGSAAFGKGSKRGSKMKSMRSMRGLSFGAGGKSFQGSKSLTSSLRGKKGVGEGVEGEESDHTDEAAVRQLQLQHLGGGESDGSVGSRDSGSSFEDVGLIADHHHHPPGEGSPSAPWKLQVPKLPLFTIAEGQHEHASSSAQTPVQPHPRGPLPPSGLGEIALPPQASGVSTNNRCVRVCACAR